MKRRLEPEWLDELPPDNPDAVRARRDLRRIHDWMGNVSAVACWLKRLADRGETLYITDLGAGDGTFMLRVARRTASDLARVKLALVDRQPVVAPETQRGFDELGWELETVEAEVFDWLADTPFANVILATLFLHHFSDQKLATLLSAVAKQTDNFFACEPRRTLLSLAASKCVSLIGCNEVTKHDAGASVRAGFRDDELSRLWPDKASWDVEEVSAGLSHRFMARLRPGSSFTRRLVGK